MKPESDEEREWYFPSGTYWSRLRWVDKNFVRSCPSLNCSVLYVYQREKKEIGLPRHLHAFNCIDKQFRAIVLFVSFSQNDFVLFSHVCFFPKDTVGLCRGTLLYDWRLTKTRVGAWLWYTTVGNILMALGVYTLCKTNLHVSLLLLFPNRLSLTFKHLAVVEQPNL